MKWFIGADGGGTKTVFAVSGRDGVPVAVRKRSGCSYQSIGMEAAVSLISEGMREVLSCAGIKTQDCAGCCIGLPCWGENADKDREIAGKLRAVLSPLPVHLVNDVEVGWAGALECHEGIHLVAGTGSIAFGRGRDHKTARCGGWTEFFGDEGSCYWIGREAMSIFSKEADGRLVRGPLYDLVREVFGLSEDYRFIDVALRELSPDRAAVAGFQRYALRAAQEGDQAAAALYEAAARELVQMAGALKEKLDLTPGPVPVSRSGGLFEAGELVLEPLRQGLLSLGCTLQAPLHSAWEGALRLAIEKFDLQEETICL